jgi:glutamine synthetase
MNLKKTLLFYCSKIFDSYGLTPMLGAELEFYCTSSDLLSIYKPKNGFDIVAEKGTNQFEIRTPVFFNVFEFIKALEDAKLHILKFAQKKGIQILFAAKPFKGLPGNSLHIHINFIDRRGCNVFNTSCGNESEMLLFSVGGLLSYLKESMVFFAPYKESYARFKESMFTPVKIAWGNNNRTAALRIITKANDVRRIEHRVPCSDSDPLSVITAIFVAIYFGLENKIIPPEKTYGNSFDKQYKLSNLPRSLERSKRLFECSEYKTMFL